MPKIIDMAHHYALARQIHNDFLARVAAFQKLFVDDYRVPLDFAQQVISNAQDEVMKSGPDEASIMTELEQLRAKVQAMEEVEEGVKKQ